MNKLTESEKKVKGVKSRTIWEMEADQSSEERKYNTARALKTVSELSG